MNRGRRISIGVIRVLYCAAIFAASLFVCSLAMNRGNTDMTMEMPGASYPTVTLMLGGMAYNTMYAMPGEVDICKLRQHLTPVDDTRSLHFSIDTYGSEVEGISFQLRSLLDGRLIEDTRIIDYVRSDGRVTGEIVLKDLVREGVEYSLCILLETGRGEQLRYYTNLIRGASLPVWEMLSYAFYFDETSYDSARAAEELTVYLESNARGDNSSFAHVDIHSSLAQVTWGGLDIRRATEPVATIREMDEETGVIWLDYVAKTHMGERTLYYLITEYFRLRQGTERMYLLDYERTMEQVFDEESWDIANNKLSLGIVDADVQLTMSGDGNHLAYVVAGRLFAYDVTGNRLADVYSCYDVSNIEDRRLTRQDYRIRVYQIDETGNIQFAVYGQINCGPHEGRCGIVVYYYDSTRNTVEEELFWPYDGSSERLYAQLANSCYVNNAGSCYLLLGDALYEISLKTREVRTLAEQLPEEGCLFSESGRSVAWCEAPSWQEATALTYMDLESGARQRITTIDGKRLRALGFFDEDLIYGEARPADVGEEASGHVLFPMDRLCIRGINGTLLKEYTVDGVYVLGVERLGDMLLLHRVVREEDGAYAAAADDQILNNGQGGNSKNTIETAVTEVYETIVQIALRSEIQVAGLQVMNPRQVIYEGERSPAQALAEEEPRYALCEKGRLTRLGNHAYELVAAADAGGGVVRDATSQVVYRRTSLPARNQIMAIQGVALGPGATERERWDACIREILAYEGVYVAGTDAGDAAEDDDGPGSASEGEDIRGVEETLRAYLPTAEVLDLTGVPLDIALSYVGQEQPVFVELADGGAVLLVGYNEFNVVLMNPALEDEPVFKMGSADAAAYFEENGNRYYTYQIRED